MRSLTDDCNLAVLLPSDREEAKAVVLELRATLAELEADAKTNLNLDLNLGKCALLLAQRSSGPCSARSKPSEPSEQPMRTPSALQTSSTTPSTV